ncbi:prephenate dehydrogenase [Solemya velum gill symbiont]|uniref:prephenate dehydrogenase n=1 Tax=Solemya velum gill symbiont TaxID=2340 RepID=UPI0009976A83|nr:prephenate dehydrogenase/arogenate dehydrogenase family protein [Solemya velum gill symbiont]OOY57147.1 prephenate dehydrogenase [Solemya velum gill symbiont]OOY58333.1 prephenate dehydrogenase [Solemya velum gill symbiont]OOY70748.1 prephenate dehydrogenase [Solemya velum gill symbiont]OOY81279.1 prephenate dehydrogenase [Solemya velum gill symbiont]OOY95102.1 prephenate dehydrogenase [Solemya velum gill symbiont]
MKIERLAIIGVGLIGGSLARALREKGVVGEVIGCGRGKENLEKAVELGVIDRYTHDIGEAVEGADVVFLAVPLSAMRTTFAAMKGHLSDNAVVTDGGSAKGSVIEDCSSVFGEALPNFVPGHPIAGTENSGVEASFAELYKDRRIILTPVSQTDESAIARVETMWRDCGAEVTRMLVVDHDRILAATSHLPHMLAFALVDMLSRLGDTEDIFRYAAGGFRDFTRIASSNPAMWRDICIANSDAVSTLVDNYAEEMKELASLIRSRDGEKLLALFDNAKQARDRYVDGLNQQAEPLPTE